MGESLPIEIAGEALELHAQRGVYWPARRTLVVADLHWGKGETFRANTIPIPDSLMVEEIERLQNLLAKTGADRLIVLGDLVHAPRDVNAALHQRILHWRTQFGGQVIVTRGNHDRNWKKLPPDWNLNWVDEWEEGPFVFAHDAEQDDERFVWSGHLHPTFRLRSGNDVLRLPCYHFGPRRAVLPAFNFFTRGVEMRRRNQDRIYVLTENRVLPV